jgi:DNA-binding HxlR family transcriptional regulator
MPVELPGDRPACLCPLEGTMETLSAKYAMQVVCAVGLHDGARFSEVEAAVPEASTSTLSARLDELEAAGLLARRQFDEIPPRVEYRLTADGEELCERLVPLLEWVCERDR